MTRKRSFTTQVTSNTVMDNFVSSFCLTCKFYGMLEETGAPENPCTHRKLRTESPKFTMT